jgi:hypothetical protein
MSHCCRSAVGFPQLGDKRTFVVELNADRDPEINGVQTSLDDLAATLNEQNQIYAFRGIYIVPTDEVLYASLTATLDRIASLKLDLITLLTKSSAEDLGKWNCDFEPPNAK